jgi:hypothetical protein
VHVAKNNVDSHETIYIFVNQYGELAMEKRKKLGPNNIPPHKKG